MTTHPRPLSPHLQVYRPQLTSILSITHRATGVALALGLILFVAWLYGLAFAPAFFEELQIFLTGIIGQIMLAGWSFCLFYHLLNGIRHLFWDMGKGFELVNVYRSGWAVVIGAILLTAFSWWGAHI